MGKGRNKTLVTAAGGAMLARYVLADLMFSCNLWFKI